VCARAQPAAPGPGRGDPDPWWGPDKALHFGATAVVAAGGYAGGALVFDDYLRAAALGSGLALGAGIAKEMLDLAGLGHPSWRDFTWDVIGVAAGIGVALSIHLAAHEPSGPAAAR
jgi:putative lipoprotein